MSAGIEFKGYVINQLGSPALYSDIFINRPAAGFTGRIFVSTDTREIYRDTGTTWELIGSGGGSVNIYNSDGTLTGNRTVSLNNLSLVFNDNRNSPISVRVSNTFTGSQSAAGLTTESNAGTCGIGKSAIQYAGYKILLPQYGYLYSNFGLSLLADSANIQFAAGGSSTAQMTLNNLGRFLLNTTIDQGYLADINGTAIIRNWLYFTLNNTGIRAVGDSNTIAFLGARNVTNSFVISYIGNEGTANSNKRLINIGSFHQYTHSTGTNEISVVYNNPQYNTTGGTNTFFGYRYNPNLISTIGLNHIAIQTDAGKNNFLETNNLQTSGLANYATYSRLTQNLPAGGSIGGGSFYTGAALLAVNNFAGNYTYGSASLNAGGYSGSTINFTAGGTLTVNQAGLRTAAGHLIFNQFGGSATGTISHFAGLQVLGLYNQATGVITPAITNAYGIVINDLNDYSHTFTFTNRWGLYQTGVLDNNYLASKLLVGTNTVTARQIHIAGDIELTTTLSATSGGSSGQHLNIWVNGTQYKIELKTP